MKFAPEELQARCEHLIHECDYAVYHYAFQIKLLKSYAYDDDDSIARIRRKRHLQRVNEKAALKALKILNRARSASEKDKT